MAFRGLERADSFAKKVAQTLLGSPCGTVLLDASTTFVYQQRGSAPHQETPGATGGAVAAGCCEPGTRLCQARKGRPDAGVVGEYRGAIQDKRATIAGACC